MSVDQDALMATEIRGYGSDSAADMIDRLWDLVDFADHPLRCWEWQGDRLPSGAGRLTLAPPDHRMVHEVVYELAYGKAAKNLVLHWCGNVSCVRPNHLYEGTEADLTRHGNTVVSAVVATIADVVPSEVVAEFDRALGSQLQRRGIGPLGSAERFRQVLGAS